MYNFVIVVQIVILSGVSAGISDTFEDAIREQLPLDLSKVYKKAIFDIFMENRDAFVNILPNGPLDQILRENTNRKKRQLVPNIFKLRNIKPSPNGRNSPQKRFQKNRKPSSLRIKTTKVNNNANQKRDKRQDTLIDSDDSRAANDSLENTIHHKQGHETVGNHNNITNKQFGERNNTMLAGTTSTLDNSSNSKNITSTTNSDMVDVLWIYYENNTLKNKEKEDHKSYLDIKSQNSMPKSTTLTPIVQSSRKSPVLPKQKSQLIKEHTDFHMNFPDMKSLNPKLEEIIVDPIIVVTRKTPEKLKSQLPKEYDDIHTSVSDIKTHNVMTEVITEAHTLRVTKKPLEILNLIHQLPKESKDFYTVVPDIKSYNSLSNKITMEPVLRVTEKIPELFSREIILPNEDKDLYTVVPDIKSDNSLSKKITVEPVLVVTDKDPELLNDKHGYEIVGNHNNIINKQFVSKDNKNSEFRNGERNHTISVLDHSSNSKNITSTTNNAMEDVIWIYYENKTFKNKEQEDHKSFIDIKSQNSIPKPITLTPIVQVSRKSPVLLKQKSQLPNESKNVHTSVPDIKIDNSTSEKITMEPILVVTEKIPELLGLPNEENDFHTNVPDIRHYLLSNKIPVEPVTEKTPELLKLKTQLLNRSEDFHTNLPDIKSYDHSTPKKITASQFPPVTEKNSELLNLKAPLPYETKDFNTNVPDTTEGITVASILQLKLKSQVPYENKDDHKIITTNMPDIRSHKSTAEGITQAPILLVTKNTAELFNVISQLPNENEDFHTDIPDVNSHNLIPTEIPEDLDLVETENTPELLELKSEVAYENQDFNTTESNINIDNTMSEVVTDTSILQVFKNTPYELLKAKYPPKENKEFNTIVPDVTNHNSILREISQTSIKPVTTTSTAVPDRVPRQPYAIPYPGSYSMPYPGSYSMPYPGPMPFLPFPPVPVMVPALTYYEPVIHDHPPISKIMDIIKKDKRKLQKMNRSSDSSSDDSYTDSSDTDSSTTDTDSTDSDDTSVPLYYDEVIHYKRG